MQTQFPAGLASSFYFVSAQTRQAQVPGGPYIVTAATTQAPAPAFTVMFY